MLRHFLIFSALTFFTHSAFAADKEEFKKLYAKFNDLYANSEDIDPIIEVAEKLYEIAPEVYGKNSQTTAVITYNLASLYDEKGGTMRDALRGRLNQTVERKAVKLYNRYFKLQRRLKVPKDAKYLDQYLLFVKAEANAFPLKSKKKYANLARSLAKKLKSPATYIAELEQNLGLIRYMSGDIKTAKGFLERSVELYKEEYGEDHFKVAETLFWLAKINFAQKDYSEADQSFRHALKIFQNSGETGHELALSTRAFLVGVYEEMGLQEEATKHCIAIGMERKKEFDLFAEPLYSKPAVYPKSAGVKGLGGNVTLEFTIDKNGIPRDIAVLESSDKVFESSSIESLEKSRFAPKVENGELVEVKGATRQMDYKMVR